MTPERWRHVKEVFAQASGLDPAARTPYLEQACGDDGELRLEVASLLSAHATADAILDRSAGDYLPLSALEASDEPRQGRRLGAYQLVECLGRGGMGEVWRARRADAQYEKEVAIKLVRGGYDTAFVLQRFRAERQILANLEHPNIARLLDAGVTVAGQPYLVMELVEGVPIDAYCTARALPIAERLRLFREVCAAVSYAHQRLVVHRDLKPGNILVSADGAIKLLDFGIAKLLQPTPADGAVSDATRTNLRALTPAFCSPEQVLGLSITTASDVYSLGVVLFHLLAGRSPYRTALESTRDAIRDVCETEPLRPSVAAAQDSGTDRARSLPDRDLDDITLKALRKEPERRYGSVEQLDEDLRRYLAGLPVLARGDHFSYRAGKFLRRHRVEVAAAALVGLALLAGIIISSREARIADAQRARAERHFASVRALANTFMFKMDDSIRDLPGSTAARELLVKTALEYLDTLSREAGTDRSLQLELAEAYDKVGDIQGQANNPNTGKPQAALASYDKAIGLLTRLTAAEPANAQALRRLAMAHMKRSRVFATLSGDLPTAAAESQRAISILERLAAAQPHDPEAQDRLAGAYGNHAIHLLWSGQTEAAIASASKAVALMEQLHRTYPDNLLFEFHLASQHTNAGIVVIGRGVQPETIEQSLAHEQQALALDQHLLDTDPEHALRYWRAIGADRADLGMELYEQGDYAGALKEYDAARAAIEKTVADRNNFQAQLDMARITHHVARARFATGRTDDAAHSFEQSLEALRALAAHGDTLEIQYLLATCEMGMGLIETRRAGATSDRAAQLAHWQAAHDWFAASVPRYERLVKTARVTLPPQDALGYDQAVTGLARSTAALARAH
jgi:serine/threonine protein kinase